MNEEPIVVEHSCAHVPVRIESSTRTCTSDEVDTLISELDTARGVVLTSRYEYPGRYTRWDIGTVHPPISIESRGDVISVIALNDRGRILIEPFLTIMQSCPYSDVRTHDIDHIVSVVREAPDAFFEEDRSSNPHVLNVVRHIRESLQIDDSHIGFYGIFGYDLGLDFMGVEKTQARTDDRDMVLYFADQLFITDHENEHSYSISYEFDIFDGEYITASTRSLERTGERVEYVPAQVEPSRDIEKGGYANIVKEAKKYFARGDLFEVVPSQAFHEPCQASPSVVFEHLLEVNPAPYGALINLGQGEWTISASPEMFVRVEGDRVESCPISGTIARGTDGITDAQQVETLLASEKDASELIMCTDVDRNDKSRVCVPGSVKVIGRRQIEMYSRLIHTVDHVEGKLLDGLDSIDAFLTHTWAVTVTGAPKLWAMRFIEEHEKTPRRFYGGAMGLIALDGTMNTGLMLRSVHVHSGSAHIRVGATLLADSIDVEEEKETELKASAMLDVVRYCHQRALGNEPESVITHSHRANDIVITDSEKASEGETVPSIVATNDDSPRVLLIDCEDSFVHTLAGYFRMAGAIVETKRVGFSREQFEKDLADLQPDIVCLSPGPSSPSDFGLIDVIDVVRQHQLPIFGVCLGLQALVEYFGGTLGQLDVPMHGKSSTITVTSDSKFLFGGLPESFEVGRYHSLFAMEDSFPDVLQVTARSDDGVIMAIEHESEPIAAVQFHPESIMTLDDGVGLAIVKNAISHLTQK
jgi:anthranilate synthase